MVIVQHPPAPEPAPEPRQTEALLVCFRCGEPGHWAYRCHEKLRGGMAEPPHVLRAVDRCPEEEGTESSHTPSEPPPEGSLFPTRDVVDLFFRRRIYQSRTSMASKETGSFDSIPSGSRVPVLGRRSAMVGQRLEWVGLRHHHGRLRTFSHVKVRKVFLASFHRQLCI